MRNVCIWFLEESRSTGPCNFSRSRCWLFTARYIEVLRKSEMHNATRQREICSSGVNSVIAQAWNGLPAPKRGRKKFRPEELVFTEACAPLNSGQAWAQTRERLSWIRMTRTVRQDARRSGKEDAGYLLFLGGFRFYGEHNCKIRKGSCRDVTWRCVVVTWRLIQDWSYLLTFCQGS